MSRSHAFYYPLILILLFGVAISLMPASPALGSNLPLGVTVQQPKLSPNSLVRYSHTFLVGSSGTPTENGTALLGARDIISNSHPSAANPYLIKLEPGNYDLGNQSLALLPFVDLEGSGEGTTVISSRVGQPSIQVTKATLIAAANSEVRLLKITNTGANPVQAAILIPKGASNARFTRLTVITSGGTDTNLAIYADGENMKVVDVTLTTSGNHSNFSLYHNTGAITLTNTVLNAFDGNGNNAALLDHAEQLSNQILTLNNSNLTAQVSTPSDQAFAAGIWVDNGGEITINNSTLNVFVQGSSAQGFGYGILNTGGIINIVNTQISSHAGRIGYGVFNSNFADLTVRNSNLDAGGTTSFGINNSDAGSLSRVANSQLSGFTAPSNGVRFCVASVNGRTFTPLDATCK